MQITGLENVPTYLVIMVLSFVFSWLTWFGIFKELDIHEVKYTQKLKRRSLWVIYANLLLLITWSRVLHLLLSRLQ
jgi:hypothetical protein